MSRGSYHARRPENIFYSSIKYDVYVCIYIYVCMYIVVQIIDERCLLCCVESKHERPVEQREV